MLVCENDISLREFTANDINDKIRWVNDEENNAFLHYELPLEYSKTLSWFENKSKTNRLDLVIEVNGVSVGLIGLLNIDNINRKAEYYILLGEKSYKGKGYAKKASQLLLAYAFSSLKLNKVYLNVDAENIAAINLYEKLGFLCEGVFKEDLFHRGNFIDRKRYATFFK